MELNRLESETAFEHKLRLCNAKLNHEIDLDWSEIVDILELDIHPDSLRKMAYGYKEMYEYIHGFGGVAQRVLSISDVHIPFNLSVDIFSKYKNIVDTIVINGDLLDCWSCSSFPKKFKINLDEELILGRQYIIDLINMINPKKIIFVTGNHEYRMQRYLNDKITDELMGVIPTDPLDMIINKGFEVNNHREKVKTNYSSIREVFEESEIEIVYNSNWYEKVGNIIFCHPLSYSSGMLKTTEKAVNYFLRVDRTFTGLIMSHTHKIGSFVQGGIKMFEQGCVCDLNKLDYTNGKLIIPNQNGYIYLGLDDSGNIIDSKTQLVNL